MGQKKIKIGANKFLSNRNKIIPKPNPELSKSGEIRSHLCRTCASVCACTWGDPGFHLLLSPIISPCTDDSIHICSAFLRGQEVTRASYTRMTRQDFLCAPSIPTLLPTDWLTALWLRPSLSQLILSSLLSSLLAPVIWCKWMLMLGGFLQHCFPSSTQILIWFDLIYVAQLKIHNIDKDKKQTIRCRERQKAQLAYLKPQPKYHKIFTT